MQRAARGGLALAAYPLSSAGLGTSEIGEMAHWRPMISHQ
jgi:hypothetical protein